MHSLRSNNSPTPLEVVERLLSDSAPDPKMIRMMHFRPYDAWCRYCIAQDIDAIIHFETLEEDLASVLGSDANKVEAKPKPENSTCCCCYLFYFLTCSLCH